MYEITKLTVDQQTAARDMVAGGAAGLHTPVCEPLVLEHEPFVSAELHNAMLELAELLESCELEPQPTFSW